MATLVAGMLTLSACGSTVAVTSRGATTTDGLGGPAATGPTDGRQAAGVDSAAGSSTSTGSNPSARASSGSSAGIAAATSALPGTVGARVTAGAPVEVGFLVTKCSNCDLLGASYVAPAHSEQQILQALDNDRNRQGGLLGHKIVPVWGVEDTASSNWSTMMQTICATFTQDHHVIAVLGAGFGYKDILSNCLAKAGVLAIDAMRTTGVPDDVELAKHPAYLVSNEPSANSYNLVALTSAVADGWLTKKTVLGAINADCPINQRVWDNTMAPYLSSHGFNVKVNAVIHCPQGASDVSSAAQAIQSAELKMRANGVDTVIITDVPLVLFAADAESQQWHPKYLATEGGAGYTAYLPADQLENIHSAGWEPTWDVAQQDQPPLSPSQHECLNALTRGGITGATSTERTLYFSLCGGVDLYFEAVSKAQSLSTSAVLGAIDSLAGAFVNPMLLNGKSLLTRSKHAAAVQYRSIGYDKTCSCFTYRGPLRQLP
jgi:hypothetical protein